MYDTTTIVNSLQPSARYGGGDSVIVSIAGGASINTTLVDTVGVWYSVSAGGVQAGTTDTLWFLAAAVKAAPGSFSYTIYDSLFYKWSKDTVFISVVERNKDGMLSPVVQKATCTLGKIRPLNPLHLLPIAADSSSTSVTLTWDHGIVADSIKIWYDTLPIPLTYYITTPVLGSINPNISSNVDSATGLNSLTRYYFGAQIYKDSLWSLITVSSSCSSSTTKGDTSTVVNGIKIDSAYFDPSTNSIMVIWSDSLAAADSLYWGESFSLDPGKNPSIPPHLYLTAAATNTSVLSLDKTIVFDTTYTVWLWLRTKAGAWSQPPIGGARVNVPTPSTGWQIVSLDPLKEIAVGLNNNIILRSGPAWNSQTQIYTDTIQYFTPPDSMLKKLGFIPVSIGFGFKQLSVYYVPFSVGIRYSSSSIPAPYKASDVRVIMTQQGPGIIWDLTVLTAFRTMSPWCRRRILNTRSFL